MKKGGFFKMDSVGDLIKHVLISSGILAIIIITYFYVYLPNETNHGDKMIVPDLLGISSVRLDSALESYALRFEISDTAFSDEYMPLDVIRQFPHPGSLVKPDRKIFLTVNRLNPPTLPLPNLEEQSLINAQAIIKSNELKVGRIIYMPSPFSDLVLEMQIDGIKVDSGMRVVKGTTIDLMVGDGAGPNDLEVGSYIGYDLKNALILIAAKNLHQGDIIIPDDVDTTGIDVIVFKQKPNPGDSVRVGHPIDLWIGPRGYTPKDSTDLEED
jgi:beta-lactam-binding protein with PASTA domain